MFECSLPGKEPWDDVAATLSRAYGIVRQWGGDISVSNGPAIRHRVPCLPSAIGIARGRSALNPRLLPSEPPPPRLNRRRRSRPFWWWKMKRASARWSARFCADMDTKCWKRPTAKKRWRSAANIGERMELLITDMLMPQHGRPRSWWTGCRSKGQMKVLYVSGYTDDANIYAGNFPPGTAFLQEAVHAGIAARESRRKFWRRSPFLVSVFWFLVGVHRAIAELLFHKSRG